MPPTSYEKNEETDTTWNTPDIFPIVAELDRVANPSTFDMNGKDTIGNGTSNDTRVTQASLDKQKRDPTAELLRLHYQFGHVSFSRLQSMARNGVLRKDVETCPLPVCPACLYGKAKRKPTQTKAKNR
jgi:hypothetical protein